MNPARHAEIVIIGGGILGCSIAYHLTRLGKTDVVLLEKSSSPTAPPGTPPAWSDSCAPRATPPGCSTIPSRLYDKLEAETGQAVDWQEIGSLRLACSPEREMENSSLAHHGEELRPGDAVAEPEGGPGPLPDHEPRRRAIRGLYPVRRLYRPGQRLPGPGQGRQGQGRQDRRRREGHRLRHREPPGRRNRDRQGRNGPATWWSTAPACGVTRSASWRASGCRASRSSTST